MLFSAVAPNLNDAMISYYLAPYLCPNVNWLDISKTINDIVEMTASSLEEQTRVIQNIVDESENIDLLILNHEQ